MNAYLIAFGGLLLLAGRLGDLISAPDAVPGRAGAVHRRVAAVRARGEPGAAGRRAVRPGRRRRDDLGGDPRDDRDDVPRAAASRRRRSASTASSPPPAARSACSSAACSRRRSTGTGSSSSTSRSGSRPACSPCALLANDAGIGLGQGADVPGAVLITGALMLGVYTIVKPAAEHGWGAASTLGSRRALARRCSSAFVVREATARTPLMPLRIFRSRNVSGANAIQALSVAGMFGMFFLGALYLQRVLGYDALEIGLAFLPTTLVMGTLSLRYSERLIMRFGARRTLLPGPRPDRRRARPVRPRARRRQLPATDVLPTMILLGAGVGVCVPGADDARDVGCDAAARPVSRPDSSTRPRRSAARSGWRCSRRCRRHADSHLLAHGHSTAAALTGGYQLAFLDRQPRSCWLRSSSGSRCSGTCVRPSPRSRCPRTSPPRWQPKRPDGLR